MKAISTKHYARLFALIFVLTGLFMVATIMRQPSAEALGTQYFDGCADADRAAVHGGGGCVDVRLLAPISNLVAYFRTKTGAEYIRFHGVNGGYSCGFDAASGGPIYIRVAGATPPPNCSRVVNVSNQLQLDTGTGLYYVPFVYYGGPGGNSQNNSALIVTQGGGQPFLIAHRGDSSGGGAAVTMRSINPNPGNGNRFWADWYIPFGPDCSVTTPRTVNLSSYDLDQLGGPQGNQRGRAITMELRNLTTGARRTWTPADSDNRNQHFSVYIEPGHRYLWIWRNIDSGNYIQFSTPYDGIFGAISCTVPSCPAGLTSPVGIVETNAPNTLRMRTNYTGTQPNLASMTYRINSGASSNIPITMGSGYVEGTTSYAAPSPGTYNVQWTLTFNGGRTHTCNGTLNVASRPYFRVYNGDVQAGGSFAALSCSNIGTGRIYAYNKGAAAAGAGAGAQVATFARGAIDQFVSAGVRSSAPMALTGLTFANNTAGTYRGSYGHAKCMPDYWADATAPRPDNSPIGGQNLVAGTPAAQQEIYVNGDAYITGNVVYSGNWSAQTTPNFRLIARGNIYISSTVSQLDGTYIAIPTAANVGGTIYTCAFGYTPPIPAQVATDCRSRLTVNGAFIARQVKLLRTLNTVYNADPREDLPATDAAEVFNFTPAVWMAEPDNDEMDSRYDSITSLPPVL